MSHTNLVQTAGIRAHVTYLNAKADLESALRRGFFPEDGERGDVAPRTVGIAVMAALAIAVGGIITTKLTEKANNLDLDQQP